MANYRTSLNITSEGTYSVELNRWTATVQITTTSQDFYSHAITVKKDDTTIDTIYFSNEGSATYLAHESGAYKFVVNYNGEIYEVPVAIQNETTYPITINRWTANITISVDAAAFHGQYLAVTKGATSYGNILIDNNGEATYSAHEAGIYTFTLTYSAHESYTVNVSAPTDGGSYSGSITRWITTINLSTSSSEFVSSAIAITKDNVAYDTIYFSNSAATIDVHEQGTYKFTVTYSNQGTTEVYDSTVVVGPSDNGQTYNKSIDRWNHTFNLSTNSTDFASSTITVKKDGANYDSTAFSSGTATYVAHATGTYQFVVTINNTDYESTTYTLSAGDDGGSTTVPAIDRWIANIAISTGTVELLGQTVTISKSGTQVGTIALASTIDTPVYYRLYDYDTGSFVVSIVWDGETYTSDTVAVSAAGNYSATIDLLKIVTFEDGTDDEIAAMLDAYYNNKITWQDMGWAIGNTRKIHLDPIAAPNGDSGTWAAQDITVVIVAHDHTDLPTDINNHSKACITVQMKETISKTDGTGGTIYIDGNSGTDMSFTKWANLYMRTYLNGAVLNSITYSKKNSAALGSNTSFKDMIKPSLHYRLSTNGSNPMTANKTDGSSVDRTKEPVTDTLFLPSYTEIFGNTKYNYYLSGATPSSEEGTQFEYYETAANRIKYPNNQGTASSTAQIWWQGSASSYYHSSNGYYWCGVDTDGSADSSRGSFALGLAPAFAM